jgi:hypothetical protein
MAYTLQVRCIHDDGSLYDYEYGREDDLEGRFQFDAVGQVFIPYLTDGKPATEARLSASGDVEQRGELSNEEWNGFVQAVASVIKQMQGTGAPPMTAHRYYG